MNRLEKRLQAKLIREKKEETKRQKREEERIKRRIDRGTKKIYYTILRTVIEQETIEDIYIELSEFKDDNDISFAYFIRINHERVDFVKTYFDFYKLKNYLEKFDLKFGGRNEITCYFDASNLGIEKKYFGDKIKYCKPKACVAGIENIIFGKRSKVCDCLLNLDTKTHDSTSVDGPTLTKK